MMLKNKAKSSESFNCKCYRPGDPEFEALANQITPLHKIRSETSYKLTLYHEEKFDYGWRRNENVNDLYESVTIY